MESLITRLRTFLQSELAQSQAEDGSLRLAAGCAAAALLELDLTAMTDLTTLTSAVPGIDEALQQGDEVALRHHLASTLREQSFQGVDLVAAVLALSGAALSSALPPDRRDLYIAGLGKSMRAAGGSLEALADWLTSALYAASFDWQQWVAATSLGSLIKDSSQAARNVTGSVKQSGSADTVADFVQLVRDTLPSVRPPNGLSAQPPVHVPARPNSDISQTISGGFVINPLQLSFIYQQDSGEERRQRLESLSAYLVVRWHKWRNLGLSEIDESDPLSQMRLEQVYISLDTTATYLPDSGKTIGPRGPQANDEIVLARPISVLAALRMLEDLDGASRSPRVILLGEPGSGKSTIVQYIAYCLAGRVLLKLGAKTPHLDQGCYELPDWTLGDLLPVHISLRDFAIALERQGGPSDNPDPLVSFIKANLGEHAAAAEYLIRALNAGQAILLFDGLDEVKLDLVDPVIAAIHAAADTYTTPILVTCRRLDYDNPRRQLRDFQACLLAPLTDKQIFPFIERWYNEQRLVGRPIVGDAAKLRQEIDHNPELHDLAQRPLLLTMMVVVHAIRGVLPDNRAVLYAECIKLLLLRWRRHQGQDLLAKLQLPNFSEPDLIGLMARIGFEAHQLETAADATSAPGAPAECIVGLSYSALRKPVLETFADYARYDDARRNYLVNVFMDEIAIRNGLLLKRGGDGDESYVFAHRSFQEFLAAYHLCSDDSNESFCVECASELHWHEVLRLMAGHLVAQRSFSYILSLISDLFAHRNPRRRVVAGELLAIIGNERVANRKDFQGEQGRWVAACRNLQAIVESRADADAPAAVRVRASEALAVLSYGQLAGLVLSNPNLHQPDPRLPLAVVDTPLRTAEWWMRASDAYWRPLAAGRFQYGQFFSETPQTVEISAPFAIGRFPVTNADFARFIAAGGYRGPAWWGGGNDERLRRHWERPQFFERPHLRCPTQPVVGVSWYEAAAYCRWLTDCGHREGWLGDDEQIRLPSSPEWEYAARHSDERLFPWGFEPASSERANYEPSQIGRPSPIGCYPAGAAACGAEEMAGNVHEWTATLASRLADPAPCADVEPGATVLMRWGDYSSDVDYLCCSWHDHNVPVYRAASLGFRLVRAKK
ncbi:MAG: SUMF1/EgtB/PvdO family nonheme iron enzyme [Chloroflexales bacterium]|nr:SUMF1/EgtB/PvdO family nonheme iron enzyme [Chloroflexales bacterium]